MRRLNLLNSIINRNLCLPFSTSTSEIVSIDSSIGNGVHVLSLNSQTNKNALNKEFSGALLDRLNTLKEIKDVRVLILRSLVPKIFCAGADLKERLKMPSDEVGPFVDKLRSLTVMISSFPLPTICAIDGIALGGGFEIALSCDIRVASSNSRMGLVETKLAIIPGAGGTQRLSRLIGPSLAKELIFCGRILDGKEAFDLKICNHIVDQNAVGDAAFQKALLLSEQITKNGPLAVKMAKEAVDRGFESGLKDGLDIEKSCYAQVIPSKDRIEGLKAFVEKRSPIYSGK